MLKKVFSAVIALCMTVALLPSAVLGASDEDLQIEAARKAVLAAEKTVTAHNDISADEFLRLISKSLPDGNTTTLSFSKESDFRLYNATSEKDGSVFANIQLNCGPYTRHEMISVKIPMLTGAAAAANEDLEKINADRAAVAQIFKGKSFDNSTTKEDILKAAQAAVINGSKVVWDDDFTKTESTETKRGGIKGTLILTLNNETATVKVNNGLRLVEVKEDDSQSTAVKNTSFEDVKAGAYYADAVKWAVEKNITTGTSETTFSPDITCTRAQIITFLWRAVGSPKSTGINPFSDISSSDYFYEAAIWASEKGMVTGNKFEAITPCTRASTVKYLWQNAGSPSVSGASAFTDVSAGADYAQAVAWAVQNGVTSGTSATSFSPEVVCSRGQIVTFLNRAIK